MPTPALSDRGSGTVALRARPRVGGGALRVILDALSFTLGPALLAGIAVLSLVPTALPESGSVVARVERLAQAYPLVLGVALFLLFAALAQYWRFYFSGAAAARPSLASPEKSQGYGVTVAVALAAGAALGLRAWIIDSYTVLSASMLPTLAPGDRIAGSKRPYVSPTRGDVIVFPGAQAPSPTAGGPELLVKRVIGLPGDRIGMSGGIPVINGWRVPTCDAGEYLYVAPDEDGTALRARLFVEFLGEEAYLTLETAGAPDFSGTYEVKPGEVFVLGDNRSHSADSRSWNGGAGGGVPLVSVAARGAWFLSSKRLDGRADLGRLLRPLRGVAPRVHVEGIDARGLEQGIERCLKERPRNSRAPESAGEAGAAGGK